MSLRNERTGEICLESLMVRSGFGGRLRGYLFRPLPRGEEGILLLGSPRVHTWGMAFPLDLFFLDGSLKVLDLARATPPNRLPRSPTGCRHVLEIPHRGEGGSRGIAAGDRLILCLRVPR